MKHFRAEWERDAVSTGDRKGDQNVSIYGNRVVMNAMDIQGLRV
jgi:hypothetical protein